MVTPTFHAQSLTELVALRASEQPDEPAVHTGVAELDGLQTLTYADIARAVDRLAGYYAPLLAENDEGDKIPRERVVAVLTSTAVDESLLEIALAKLGLAALLLSVNNSAAAVAHLCKLTKAEYLIYGAKYAATATRARDILREDGIELSLLEDKRFPLWGPGGLRDPKTHITAFPPRLTPEQESKRTCVILHSSGSTGFPKPVYVSHYGLIANAAVSVPKTGFSALPLFHGFGHFSIFRCIYHGKAFTLLPPHLPITAANIVRTIESSPTRPVQHFAVPYVLKLLSEDAAGVASLAGMEAVSFAGAALPDDLGDRLVAAGVPLYSQYGTTETGALLTSRREYASDRGWNWLRVEGLIAAYLELVPHGEMFESVVKDGWPGKVMSNAPDGSYATKDLFVRHPQHSTWVKYVGRLDDTLTQTLGEKTNPVPMELAIRGNSPLVQECIVFGDGRPLVGALILPSDAGAELSKDREAYITAIWPVVAEANAQAPTHSRILPEMIEILPHGTDVPVATKMSILRPACYVKFKGIIDAVYERFEEGGSEKRDINTAEEMEAFVSQTIHSVLSDCEDLGRDTDLFAYGVDSLQATRIRNVLQKTLVLDVKLGQNIVYEFPSISQLSAHLLALRSGTSSEHDVHAEMLAMVDKWAAEVIPPTHNIPAHKPLRHIVLLTGATGSLGAHILDHLVRRDDVVEVICLSRAKDEADSLRRIRDSLSLRKRNVSMEKIRSYAADVNRADLGLGPELLDALRPTIVIHNAWPVNFNLSLASFDKHVGGAVNLLNLAHRQQAAFFFSSSVGTCQVQCGVVGETFPTSPSSAAGMGYARSKWVVEKVIESRGGNVLRIGQLVGDTEHGVWNETEAWPLMFRAATTIGSLPLLDERPEWLPVNEAASAIAEIVLGHTEQRVYHVLNTYSAVWTDILAGLRRGGLEFDTVTPEDWITRLASSDPDVGRNPTYKLLEFYRGRLGRRASTQFDVTLTQQVSPTIAACRAIDSGLVALWTRHWIETGFFRVP